MRVKAAVGMIVFEISETVNCASGQMKLSSPVRLASSEGYIENYNILYLMGDSCLCPCQVVYLVLHPPTHTHPLVLITPLYLPIPVAWFSYRLPRFSASH